MITPATMTPTPTTTTPTAPKITKPIRFIKNGINDDMVDVLIKAISVIVDRTVKNQHGKKSNNHFLCILATQLYR